MSGTDGGECAFPNSKQPLRPPQIPERSQVGQREGEAILIFVAHRAQRKAAEFDIKTATIPVVGGLHCGVLDEAQVRIDAEVGSGAESLLAGMAIAQQEAELVEGLGRWRCTGVGGFGRHLQEGVASPERERSQAVVNQYRAGGHVAQCEVVVHVPLHVRLGAGLNAEARDQRFHLRAMVQCSKARDSARPVFLSLKASTPVSANEERWLGASVVHAPA